MKNNPEIKERMIEPTAMDLHKEEEIRKDLESLLGGCSSKEPFALQVLGDSMDPEFPDKCVIVIAPSQQAPNNSYVFAEVEHERWFRKYSKDEQGIEWLVAENDAYPKIELTDLNWHLHGVITQRNFPGKRKLNKKYSYHNQAN